MTHRSTGQNRDPRNRPTQIQPTDHWQRSKSNSTEKEQSFAQVCTETIGCSYAKKKKKEYNSGQDSHVGRHGSPLHTTTSKLQLKYRTTITSGKSGIKLSGSLTTTELKKPHPPRHRTGWPHSHVDKNSGGYLGSEESQPHTSFPTPSV